MVQAVGTYHPFRTAWLDLSVTTDDVMVADTKLVMSVTAVPGVDLSGRGCLVGPYCRTMNNQQCNCSHNYSLFTIHYSLNYAQLIVASAVAIDVAIVATHLKIDTTTFFETFISSIIHYSLFTIHYSLFTIHSSLFTITLLSLLRPVWSSRPGYRPGCCHRWSGCRNFRRPRRRWKWNHPPASGWGRRSPRRARP